MSARAVARAKRLRSAPVAERFVVSTEAVEKLARAWLDRVRPSLGTDLVSAYLVGSCLTQDFDPRRSDVNVLLIVKSLGRESLERLARTLPAAQKRPRIAPILYTASQIERSLDVFPVEFADLQERHVLLEGAHTLSEIVVPREALRLQLESRLRRLAGDLRHAYVMRYGSARALGENMIEASRGLSGVLRTLLRLRGEVVPGRTMEVIERVAEVFGLEAEHLLAPHALRHSMASRRGPEIRRRYLDYLYEVERLAGLVDRLRP